MSSRARVLYTAAFYIVDMILFGLALAFIDNSTVLPDFVGQATDSKVLVGLTGILFPICWRLPQLAMAPTINRIKRKRRAMLLTSTPGRVIFFVIAAGVAGIGTRDPGLMLLVFFVGYAFFAIGDGVTTLIWVEMVGNALPDSTRGVMFGLSQVVTGIAVLFIQGLLRQILGPSGPGYPMNFAVVFSIAGGLLALSLPFLANLYEKPADKPPRAIELSDYLPYLTRILREDHPYRKFLTMRFVLEFAYFSVTPFYIGYGIQQFGISSAQAVGDSLIAVTVGNISGSLIGGWLSHRFTSRAAIRLAGLCVVIGPLAALAASVFGSPLLLISFGTIGMIGALSTPGLFNWLISYPPVEDRAMYTGIGNTLGAFALLAPVIGGLIVQVTSYNVLFGLTVGTGLIGGFLALGLALPKTKAAPLESVQAAT